MFKKWRKQAKEEQFWQEKEQLWQEKQQLWDQFREWYQSCEQARHFTFMKCLHCAMPASSSDANFCSNCGASFHTEPGMLTAPGRYTTEPLPPVERPADILRRQLQERRQTRQQRDVSEIPTRAFRTVRLDRIPQE